MEIPIGINIPEQTFVDPLGQALIDVVTSSSGVKPRPGTKGLEDTETGEPITGIFNWEEQDQVVLVSNGKLFKFIDDNDFYLLLEGGDYLTLEDGTGVLGLESEVALTDITGDTINNDQRAIFASYGDILYIAFGGRIVELHPETSVVTHSGTTYTCIKNNIDVEPGVTSGWETYWSATGTSVTPWVINTRYGSGTGEYIEDADCPTTVSFIGITNKTLLALEDGTQRMWFSAAGAPWQWDSEWVSAEFMPDDATCMRIFNGDVWVGGRQTIQSFDYDGITPFVSSSYGGIKSGVLAPFSFIDDNNGAIFYIDGNRRLVYLNERTATVVSESVDTFLNTISKVSDAIADYIVIDGVSFYILQFPTENKTLSLNLDNKTWSVWHTNTDTSKDKWMVNCITYVPSRDLVMSGSTTGEIMSVSSSYKQDMSDDIESTIRTQRIQTPERIFVKDLVVGLTKVATTTDASVTSTVSVRWRDDGKDWSGYLTKTVDGTETDQVLHFRRVGSYRNTRQYEFDCSSLYPYAIRKVDQL